MTASNALPEYLVAYLMERDAQRASAVDTLLTSLTERERALVRDAAVMGYVRGTFHPRGEEVPLNKAIVAEVVSACFTFPSLYPAINADIEDQHQTIEYFVQCQQPDGTWESCSSPITNPRVAVEQRAAHRRAHPDCEYRIARRTTTVLIEAEQPERVDLPCGECGHPQHQHTAGDDPVSPGQCRQCVTEGDEDNAWHDYEEQQ
ncbi:hypothetical protein [Streptomyces olivaceiscleroticus]|uniref:Uncharacterized protein n=1 Tax=Streptomyces olivaceiscleroticus TaxID=68245 RepID=A0ABN1BM92_9ACTN